MNHNSGNSNSFGQKVQGQTGGAEAAAGADSQPSSGIAMTSDALPQRSEEETGYLHALLQGSWSSPPKFGGRFATQSHTEHAGTNDASAPEFNDAAFLDHIDHPFVDGPFADGPAFNDSGFGDGGFSDGGS